MSDTKTALHIALSDAVVEMDEEQASATAQQVIAQHFDAYEAIAEGLAPGMARAGQLFEEDEYFVPELLLCADAMYAGINVLQPHVRRADVPEQQTVVIGVIEGDTHDIGKNLVKLMLASAGFTVIDLGRDVPPQRFVEAARQSGAVLIAISTLMTTTMDGLAEVIRLLERNEEREQYKVMVGGAPISLAFAKKIGADGYARDASEAVRLARQLVGQAVAYAG